MRVTAHSRTEPSERNPALLASGETFDRLGVISTSMTDQEIKPYLGKPARVTLADGRVLAGVLRASDDHGHGHRHYAVFSGALREGEPPVRELIHGGDQITNVEDASGDPAASL